MATRECLIVLLDVGLGMSGGMLLRNAVEAVTCLVREKIHFAEKDHLSFVLFGTEEASNPCDAANVFVVRDPEEPDLELLKVLPDITCDKGFSNFLGALEVAGHLLELDPCKIKRIFLITEADSPHSWPNTDANPWEEVAASVVDTLTTLNVSLNVIGCHAGTDRPQGKHWHILDHVINRMDKGKGKCFPFDEAIQLLHEPRGKAPSERAYMVEMIDVTPDLKIPAQAYIVNSEVRMPPLKRYYEGEEVRRETVHRSLNEPWELLTDEDLVKGYRYGKQLVPFNSIDELVLKRVQNRSIMVLAFAAAADIPPHICLSKTVIFFGHPGSNEGMHAFAAFTHALAELDMVAIVRFVYNRASAPKLGVLLPNITPDFQSLLYSDLPFMDDIRPDDFPRTRMTDDILSNMQVALDLVDSSMLPPERDLPTEIFNPVLQNWYRNLERRALDPEAPVIPLGSLLEVSSSSVEGGGSHSREGIDLAAAAFAEAFPTQLVPKAGNQAAVKSEGREGESIGSSTSSSNDKDKDKDKDKGKARMVGKRLWADAMADVANVTLDEYAERGAEKKPRDDSDGVPEGLSDVPRPKPTIDIMDPVGSFKDILTRKDADFVKEGIEGLCMIIRRLLAESLVGSHHGKAADCLKALREGCIAEKLPQAYNAFLAVLKMQFSNGQHSLFWKMLSPNESIYTLISEEECDEEGAVDSQTQAAFFPSIIGQRQPVDPNAELVEDNELASLLDDLE